MPTTQPAPQNSLKMSLFRLFVLCLAAGAPLSAQLHFGVKGGVPLNDAVKATNPFRSEFARWTFGGVAELDLPAGLGLELDMLYRRTGYSTVDSSGGPGPDQVGNSFEFPLLVKYKFPGILARPYMAGGLSFRKISDIPNVFESGSRGVVLGAGLRFNALLVRISPELRYTRWNNEAFRSAAGALGSSRNQVELLVGITF
ncbi:MAG TPA: outer membrane beta-barrel protein [Bryobacteraceae bacterium]|nr:outer membrane beta-barrel protein [Bryobacteraceae bacterium]